MVLDKNSKTCITAGFSEKAQKNLILSHAEIIENFEMQEKSDTPHFAWIDYKTQKAIAPKGFLIWSLWEGCGVAYRCKDGAIVLCEGRQGDFGYFA